MRAIYRPTGKALEYAALACNLYAGCTHGCSYCYAPSILRTTPEDFHATARPRPGILGQLRKDALKYRGSADPVLLSFTADPYQPAEETHRVTREAIEILLHRGIPVHVLTKGGTRAVRDFDLLAANARNAFGTTLVLLSDADRLHWEPGAATVASRIRAIREAHERGIHTWVSVEPVIVPEQALRIIEHLSPWVDEFRAGKLNYHPLAAEIDWQRWAPELLRALQGSGRSYLVKRSLACYLPEGAEVQRQVGSEGI